MSRTCERCKRPLKDDQYGVCDECRTLRTIKAHQDHIISCSELISGKWGSIDESEFEKTQAEIVRASKEIDRLASGSVKQCSVTVQVIKPPKDPIYSDNKRLELYRRCIANGIKDGISADGAPAVTASTAGEGIEDGSKR